MTVGADQFVGFDLLQPALLPAGDHVRGGCIVGLVAFAAGSGNGVTGEHCLRRRDVAFVLGMVVGFAVAGTVTVSVASLLPVRESQVVMRPS